MPEKAMESGHEMDAAEMERLAFLYGGSKNALDATKALSVCSEDFTFEVATGRPVRIVGWQNVQTHLAELWGAIPDLHTRVDWTVAGSSRLVAGGMLSGTLRGAYFGAQPTGRRFEVALISVLTFAHRRLVSESNHVDMLSLLTQAGVLEEREPDRKA
ncbi:MAG: ester cyclase [Candidatus Binatia bacterium]